MKVRIDYTSRDVTILEDSSIFQHSHNVDYIEVAMDRYEPGLVYKMNFTDASGVKNLSRYLEFLGKVNDLYYFRIPLNSTNTKYAGELKMSVAEFTQVTEGEITTTTKIWNSETFVKHINESEEDETVDIDPEETTILNEIYSAIALKLKKEHKGYYFANADLGISGTLTTQGYITAVANALTDSGGSYLFSGTAIIQNDGVVISDQPTSTDEVLMIINTDDALGISSVNGILLASRSKESGYGLWYANFNILSGTTTVTTWRRILTDIDLTNLTDGTTKVSTTHDDNTLENTDLTVKADIDELDGKVETNAANILLKVNQTEFDAVVIEGDSSVEAAQARVASDGITTYTTLKERLDAEYNNNKNNPKFNSTLETEAVTLGEELLDTTGWTQADWSGDFITGFTHITGNTTALSRTMISTGTKKYIISFTVSSALISGDLTVSIGNSIGFDLYEGPGTTNYSIGVQSISDGNLVFTPSPTFSKTITNISVKEITNSFASPLTILDSSNNIALEIRPTLASKNNIFIGTDSGKTNVSGYENIAAGSSALKNNVSGFWNTAIGRNSLSNNIGGSRNIALGYQSLNANISGQRNISIGTFSLPVNTIGDKNISIGADSMFDNISGSKNIAIGMSALYDNTTANENVAIGVESGFRITTGENNTAIGSMSLHNITTGINNVAIGAYSQYLTTGNENTSIGKSALHLQTIGSGNTAIGYNAGRGASTGVGTANHNVFIGDATGSNIRDGANNNVFIGYNTGSSFVTGTDNILIGYNEQLPSTDKTHHLNIGGLIYGDLSIGKIGIGVVEPTAYLHLKAGTIAVGKAPLKFEAGNLNTIPEAGAIEYDGTNLYFTDSTGTRHTLAVVA